MYYNYIHAIVSCFGSGRYTLGTYYCGSYLIVCCPLGLMLLSCTVATCIMVLIVLLCVWSSVWYFPHGC